MARLQFIAVQLQPSYAQVMLARVAINSIQIVQMVMNAFF
jgi:hypothetical protein